MFPEFTIPDKWSYSHFMNVWIVEQGGREMIWVLLLLYTVFVYYFVLKSDSKTSSKVLSLFSGGFLILTITPMWSFSLFMIFIDISPFIPFVIGILGIIFGWFGVKEGIRGILLFTNILAVLFYLFVFLIGKFGFQQPWFSETYLIL